MFFSEFWDIYQNNISTEHLRVIASVSLADTFTYSKSTIEIIEKGVKYIQSDQSRHPNDVNDVSFWCINC